MDENVINSGFPDLEEMEETGAINIRFFDDKSYIIAYDPDSDIITVAYENKIYGA